MRKGFRQLIAIESLVTLAGSLAGVFSIVYLVRMSLTFFEASLFYIVAFAFTTVLCLAAARTGFRRPRRWMAVAMVSLALFYLSFNFLEGYWLLAVTPFFFGPYIVGFWVPFNVLILRQTTKSNRGETLGLFFLVFPTIGVAAPLVSGYLIDNIGYWLVFGCAVVALLTNAFLIGICPVTSRPGFRPRINFRGMGRRLSLGFFLQGGQEGVWFTAMPLLSLTFADEETLLGILFSLFALAGGISAVFAGRISDRRGIRLRYVRIGVLGTAPFIVLAAVSPDLYAYAFAMAMANLFIFFVPVFLFTLASDRMEGRDQSLSLTRELLLNAGRVLGGSVCALMIFATDDIRLAYVISAAFVAGILSVK
jgi:MFS family permease